MAGIFQRYIRRQPITVMKIELNGNRFTLEQMSQEGNMVHDGLRELAYTAPEQLPPAHISMTPLKIEAGAPTNNRRGGEEGEGAHDLLGAIQHARQLTGRTQLPVDALDQLTPQDEEEGSGSTVYELRSQINIKKGSIMKIMLLDAQKGCSTSLRRSSYGEFLEWYGSPELFGSVFSSGILQTVLQRRARMGTMVIVLIIGLILGGLIGKVI